MKDIKFRAWDKERRMMQPFAFISTVRGNEPETLEDAFDIAEYRYQLMQYTGLKDKNGVEIYEGDVIKAKHDDGRYDVGEVVYGSKGAFCLHLPNVATGIKTPLLNYIHGIMFAEFDFEVIGNIYENPELLESNQ